MRTALSASEILSFWFGQTVNDDQAIGERMQVWFGSGPGTDETIRERFSDIARQAAAGELGSWKESARTLLALILLLDQFPRNLHRGTPAAFAQDPVALDLCMSGLGRKLHETLTCIEQVFFLMPLQHAESRPVQETSLRQYEMLLARVPNKRRKSFQGFVDYARLHCDIVQRFGRFPHRNAILKRKNTPEEEAYLSGDVPRFGQS